MSLFNEGLSPNPVNHIALTPLSFIERTASVYPEYPRHHPWRDSTQLGANL